MVLFLPMGPGAFRTTLVHQKTFPGCAHTCQRSYWAPNAQNFGNPQWTVLPHQVWGVWFIVERILADRPSGALIADDMGLGKTHCALVTLLYLKYIMNQAAAGIPLPCLDEKSVAQFKRVPRIFDTKNGVCRRPAIIIVPANLVHVWERAAQTWIGESGLNLTNLHSRRDLTRNQLNYSPDKPERGRAIHLISYSTYQTRY